MKINFTKAEYRVLLDLVSLGEWVLTAHDTEDVPKKKKYEEVVQKIFSYAKEIGFEKLIIFNPGLQRYFGTREYDESEKEEYLEEFEENTFWTELINRLAERDFLRENGLERVKEMSLEEKIREIHKHEEKWSEELGKHGIDRLKIGET